MSVKFINCWTGTEMWVTEDRVEEYKAAGHMLPAASPSDTVSPTKEETVVKKTTTAKKRTVKK